MKRLIFYRRLAITLVGAGIPILVYYLASMADIHFTEHYFIIVLIMSEWFSSKYFVERTL